MRKLAGSLVALLLIVTACAPVGDSPRRNALYDKYDAHCREHAEKNVDSPDVESLYRECMNYFIKTDVSCQYCVVGSHTNKK